MPNRRKNMNREVAAFKLTTLVGSLPKELYASKLKGEGDNEVENRVNRVRHITLMLLGLVATRLRI